MYFALPSLIAFFQQKIKRTDMYYTFDEYQTDKTLGFGIVIKSTKHYKNTFAWNSRKTSYFIIFTYLIKWWSYALWTILCCLQRSRANHSGQRGRHLYHRSSATGAPTGVCIHIGKYYINKKCLRSINTPRDKSTASASLRMLLRKWNKW